MKIKVCGMTDSDNIKGLTKLPIDYIGFIFYPGSPRYAKYLDLSTFDFSSETIARVGVFVNEIPSRMFSLINDYKLDVVQLHGSEDLRYCQFVKDKNPELKIIKAFSISEAFDFKLIKKYGEMCDYFLFDTKTSNYGGSGKKFDWSVLNEYTGSLPFFLSGGISEEDVDTIKNIDHPQLYGLDLNSKFETNPGIKNIALLEQFLNEIKG